MQEIFNVTFNFGFAFKRTVNQWKLELMKDPKSLMLAPSFSHSPIKVLTKEWEEAEAPWKERKKEALEA